MIDNAFLDVRFADITLLHILLVLGNPYILFYILQKKVEFCHFEEKWEAGLFVFSIGATINLTCIYFIGLEINFWTSYFALLIISQLVLIYLIKSKKHYTKKGWTLIKLKNGKRIKCIINEMKNNFIYVTGNSKNNIIEIDENNKDRELEWTGARFKVSEVNAFFYKKH